MLNKNLQKMTFSTKVYKNRINGQWVASQGKEKFDILDPVSLIFLTICKGNPKAHRSGASIDKG